MPEFPSTWTGIPEETRHILSAYLVDAKKIIGEDVDSIILYGSLARGDFLQGRSNINILMIFLNITLDILNRCSKLNRRWAEERILAPLMFTRHELSQFVNAFPLEFLDIREKNIVLFGHDPFPELFRENQNLLHECKREIRGNILRVRQQFVEADGQPEGIYALLPISLTALIPCIRGLYRLLREPTDGTPDSILDRLTSILQVDDHVFREVWLMKRGQSSPGKHEAPKLLERYLHALVKLAEKIDTLEQEGRFK